MKRIIWVIFLIVALTMFFNCPKPGGEEEINNPPTITILPGDCIVLNGEAQQFTTQANDPDGDPLTYIWYVDNVQQGTSSAFSYFATPAQDTTFDISVKVSDGELTDTDAVYLKVLHPLTAIFLDGTVKDGAENPITGAYIHLYYTGQSDATYDEYAVSGYDGYYRFYYSTDATPDAGTYYLVAARDGYTLSTTTVEILF